MSCGGRVYKGDTVIISVPFDVDDYSNLTITYTTTGDSKIVLTEEDVVVEDGFITHTFQGHDLDLLPDGVIYYTISYEVDGVDHLESTNTPFYLKTPAGYEGITPEDIWQSGYTAGLEDCSSGTPCDCSSAYTEGYHDGYNQAQEECSGGSCDLQTKYIKLTAHTQTFTAPKGNRPTPPSGASVVYGGDYEQFINLVSGNTDSELAIRGYNGQHTISFIIARFYFDNGALAFRKQIFDGATYMDDVYDEWTLIYESNTWGKMWAYNDRSNLYLCLSITNDWYFDGVEKEDLILPTKPIDGYDVIHVSSDLSGSSCNLALGVLDLQSGDSGTWIMYANQDGLDGYDQVQITDFSYGQAKYAEGYNQGIAACGSELYSGYWCTEESWNGEAVTLTPLTHFASTAAGFSSVTITDCGYGAKKFNQGYSSGYTAAQSEYSGSVSNSGYVWFDFTPDTSVSDLNLYNTGASTDYLISIEINGNLYSGSTYSGNIARLTYKFNGGIPDYFFKGCDFSGLGIGMVGIMGGGHGSVGVGAFENCQIDGLSFHSARGQYVTDPVGIISIQASAVNNTSIAQISFGGISGHIIAERNSVINNSNLHSINIQGEYLSDEPTLFYGSAPNGTISSWYHSDVVSRSWFNNISNWTYM